MYYIIVSSEVGHNLGSTSNGVFGLNLHLINNSLRGGSGITTDWSQCVTDFGAACNIGYMATANHYRAPSSVLSVGTSWDWEVS